MSRRFFALLILVALVVAACTPPAPPAIRVTAVSPTLNQTDVEVNAVVSTTFSVAVTESTLEDAFSLSSEDGAVSGTVSYDSATRTATFTPDADLAYETEYTATWATSLRGAENARLAREYSWVFTTAEDPAEDPAVSSVTVTPADTEIEIGATAQLSANVVAVGGADESVTWASGDEAVATVSADGVVTAVAPGTATITATSVFDNTVTGSASVTVLAAEVLSVVVAPDEATLEIGDTEQLGAAVTAVSGADETVTWTSDDDSVATVDADGLVTAVAAGTTTITATSVFDGAVSGNATITVLATDVLSIVVAPNEATLEVGDTEQLGATVNGVSGADESVTWSSDDETVATVDADGLVTAVAPGTTTITATSVANPAISGSATINVAGVTNLTVAPDPVNLKPAATAQLLATVTALHGADEAVTWASDDDTVATVDADGLVTAVAGGTTTVTATSVANPALSASATINVQTVAVTVAPSAADLIVGGTTTLTATVTVTGGADDSVAWASDNQSVATVDQSGVVTAVAAGTATITATSSFDDTVVGTATVTVHDALTLNHFLAVDIVVDTGVLAEDLAVSGGLAPYDYEIVTTPPAGWPEDYDDVPYDDISELGPMRMPPASVTVDAATGMLVGTVADASIDPEDPFGWWQFFIEVTDDLGQTDYAFVQLRVLRAAP